MKAWILGSKGLELSDMELDPLRAGWTRLKVVAAGICGSDAIKIQSGSLPAWHTRVLGHEFVGEVRQESGELYAGDRVVAMPLLPCGACRACRAGRENLCAAFHAVGRTAPGAFAEFVDVPTSNLSPLPHGPGAEVFVLTDPLAVCLHAIHQSGVEGRISPCAIFGDGSIGCLLAWALLQIHCPVRLKARHPLNAAFATSLGVGLLDEDDAEESFEFVFEAVGRAQGDSLKECMRVARPGGTITVLGTFTPEYVYPLSPRDLFIRETSLRGANAYLPWEFREAMQMVIAHREALGRFISHRFPRGQFPEALLAMVDKSGFSMKVLLDDRP